MQIGAILAQLFVCLPVLSSDVCLSTVGLAAKLKRDVLFNAYTHTLTCTQWPESSGTSTL